MSDPVRIQIVNLNEFKAQLAALAEKGRGKTIVTALRAGALVVRNAAKENVHRVLNTRGKGTGNLARSIHIEVESEELDKAAVDIGTDLVYAPVHEFGAIITPKKAKMLHWVENGIDIWAHAVQIPARPYLRPAMDENVQAIQDAVTEALRQLLGAT